LAAYRLDCRLAGLAQAAGGFYTRYADDLVFSGDKSFAAGIKRFHLHACAIALEEGFEVQTRKTRIMRRAVAQKAGGLVLNDRANVPRRVYEELKAILYNCVRHGPVGENRNAHPDFRGHLRGRIAHVERVHPRHAEKLRVTFDKIIWDSPS
jgi:hypothetical protein